MTEPFVPRWNVWLCCSTADRFCSYNPSWWCVHQLRMFRQASARIFLIWKFKSSTITHDKTVWSEVERVIVLFNCRSFLLIQHMLMMRSLAKNVQSSVRTTFFDMNILVKHKYAWQKCLLRGRTCVCAVQKLIVFAYTVDAVGVVSSKKCPVRRLQNLYLI